MKKLLEKIGVRLYAIKYIPKYRTDFILKTLLFITALPLPFLIYETAVY